MEAGYQFTENYLTLKDKECLGSFKVESDINKNNNSSDTTEYLTAMMTKPFLLLAGISGTGKSRIVRKFAQATVTPELQGYTGTDFGNDRWNLHKPANFEIIQVKPNWHNSMDVVGYLSNIPAPHYEFTPFIDFIVRAWLHPTIPFFLCLDEMNLAPVEEYFAEFLSAIESRSKENGVYTTDPIIKPFKSFAEVNDESGRKINIGKNMLERLLPANSKAADQDHVLLVRKSFWNNGISLPENLIVIGTVNMDDTTFSFSRKVLDRAMSFEMNEVNYNEFLNGTTDDGIKKLTKSYTAGQLHDLIVNRPVEAKEITSRLGGDASNVLLYLTRVNALLDETPFKLGYRAANEALIYVDAYRQVVGDNWAASMDRFTLMKILSRIEGDESKLKITDSKADQERLKAADVDPSKIEGELTLLSALKYIIEDSLGSALHKNADSATSTEESEEADGAERLAADSAAAEQHDELKSVKKLDWMISLLDRDHVVSFWN